MARSATDFRLCTNRTKPQQRERWGQPTKGGGPAHSHSHRHANIPMLTEILI